MKNFHKFAKMGAWLLCLAVLLGALASCGLFPKIEYNDDLYSDIGTATEASEVSTEEETTTDTSESEATTETPSETTSVLPDDTVPVETTAVETVVETEPVPETLVTPEEFDRINIAWSKKYGIGVQFLKSIDDIKTVDIDGSAWAYLYGKFDDCLVLFSFDALYESGEMSLAGHTFVFPVDYTLWVCKGTTYYTLEDAFKKGALTHEQIGAIAEIHRQNMSSVEPPSGK